MASMRKSQPTVYLWQRASRTLNFGLHEPKIIVLCPIMFSAHTSPPAVICSMFGENRDHEPLHNVKWIEAHIQELSNRPSFGCQLSSRSNRAVMATECASTNHFHSECTIFYWVMFTYICTYNFFALANNYLFLHLRRVYIFIRTNRYVCIKHFGIIARLRANE